MDEVVIMVAKEEVRRNTEQQRLLIEEVGMDGSNKRRTFNQRTVVVSNVKVNVKGELS